MDQAMKTTSPPEPITLARASFIPFAVKAFGIVNQGTPFAANRAFLPMAHALEEVASGRCQRLLITVPPRSGKSLLASVALPAFILGKNPAARIICASYSGDLSEKLHRDCRTVLTHGFYRQLFPATVIGGKNTQSEFETAHGGFRFATSVGGTLTGRGGDFIIIDDPIKPDEAMSEVARKRSYDWFTGTVGSRLDNKTKGAMIVVMQRLHVEDIAGHILDREGWHHLDLPAIAEREALIPIGGGHFIRRRSGEVLDPSREPRTVLDQLRADMGSAAFEAQYQQQPIPQEGAIINWNWMQFYDTQPQLQYGDNVVISWDTAFKDNEINDYTVGILALVKANRNIFILDVIRQRMKYPELRARVRQMAAANQGLTTLVESAGSGIVLLQDLMGQINLIGVHPIGDKVMRFSSVSPMIEGGQMFLPKKAPWLDIFKREVMMFPNGANDDQVDALSQLLNWVKSRFSAGPVQTRYRMR